MATYNFTRTLVDGCYDIDGCNKEPLLSDIKSDVIIPTGYIMSADGANGTITFAEPLTTEQETELNTVITDYKQ